MNAALSAKEIRNDIPILSETKICYLDNAATSLMPRQVISAAADYDSRIRANVGRGVYPWAEQASAEYENARDVIANALGARREEVVFCGGATAALNMLAISIVLNDAKSKDKSIWLAQDNHHSNILPWQMAAQRCGATTHFLPATASGAPDIEMSRKALAASERKPLLIAVSHAANVSGEVCDLSAMSELAREFGALLVADGAQSVPRGLSDAARAEIHCADCYVFSGHKCYAPNGIGVLRARHALLDSLVPAFSGGGMVERANDNPTFRAPPHKWEAGTPPVSQAIALAAAFEWMQQRNIAGVETETRNLAGQLRDGLRQLNLKLLGTDDSSPVVSFTAENAHPHDICQLLAEDNVAARGGHHCAQPLMNYWRIIGCTRFSIAPYNTVEDITAAVTSTERALNILQ